MAPTPVSRLDEVEDDILAITLRRRRPLETMTASRTRQSVVVPLTHRKKTRRGPRAGSGTSGLAPQAIRVVTATLNFLWGPPAVLWCPVSGIPSSESSTLRVTASLISFATTEEDRGPQVRTNQEVLVVLVVVVVVWMLLLLVMDLFQCTWRSASGGRC